jgi:Lrp/AsnC family leucine-responsive transcriptional regulator
MTTFEGEILKLEEVSECFHVSGDYDYILKIFVKDMDIYKDFVITKRTAIKYIGSTHSTFTIEQVKKTAIYR